MMQHKRECVRERNPSYLSKQLSKGAMKVVAVTA